MTILDQLRTAIDKSKLTQTQIADKADISQAQVSRVLQGKQGTSLDTAERIAKAVGRRIVLR